MRNTLREFLKLSRPLHSVSVVAKQAPLALSNAKFSCKYRLWLIARVNKKQTFLGLFFIFKFWNEFYQIEKKTRIKKFQKKLSKNKNILLVAQRNILANVSFIFGAISIYVFWLLLFPAPGLLGAGYWIARGISIIWFSYGLIFSCFILKKKIVYSKGNLNIRHDDGLEFIPILEVKRIKFIQIENGKAGLRPLEAQLLLFNVEILKCSNIDKIVFFEEKFEIIKQYDKLKYEVKGKDEYE